MEYISFPGLGIEPYHINKGFELFGRSIAWYGVIICIGIILGVSYSLYRAKCEEISVDTITDLAFFLVIFGVIGARLYYVIFEFDKYLVTGQGFFGNLWGTIKNAVAIWEGGLGIYGAIIAGFLVVLIFCRVKKLKLLQVCDLAAPGVMLGQLIGRWGNFINVEAYGADTTLPWRMGIHYIKSDGTVLAEKFVHPTFLYESLWNLVGFAIISFFYRKKKFNGQVFFFYMAWYGFGRMLIEGLRTDSLYLGPIRISQLVGLVTFIVGVALTILFVYRLKTDKLSPVDISKDKKIEAADVTEGYETAGEDSSETIDNTIGESTEEDSTDGKTN